MVTQELKRILTAHHINETMWQASLADPDRAVRITTEAGTFWLKKSAPARGIFRYHVLNFFSWITRLPLLRAVPQPGGQAALATERHRLQQLHSADIMVPKIIAHDQDWLLLKSIGTPVVKLFKDPGTSFQQKRQLFMQCLDAINDTHQKGCYLSQAFARNLLLEPQSGQIGFIDFEDDPLQVMNLPEAQARDLLLLVNSTTRFFVSDNEFYQQRIQQFLSCHDSAMVDALQRSIQRMQWITKLPLQKYLGHDYQKLKLGILALKKHPGRVKLTT